jgi:hypothetical protein
MSQAARDAKKAPWKLHPELHSDEARRKAATVLDVLAGVMTPAEAAAAVTLTPLQYLALERRAIEGLLGACERRTRGPRRSPEREVAELKREVKRLGRENARSAALLRITQRALGLRAPEPKPAAKDARGRKRRKPMVRALRAAAALRASTESAPVETGSAGGDNAPAA